MALNFEPDWVTIISYLPLRRVARACAAACLVPPQQTQQVACWFSPKERFAPPKVEWPGGQAFPTPSPSSLSKNEHKKPRSPRPGLFNARYVGLINPHRVVVFGCGDGSLPSSCLSFFRRVEEALAPTIRGFFYN
jgi:hypothetical protein